MTHDQTLEDRLAKHYAGLSGQLQKAADFVAAHPLDIASRSLRAISAETDVSPATFSRLSRALGYASFEDMKTVSRQSVGQQVVSLSARAEALRQGDASGKSMLQRQSRACVRNIEDFASRVDEEKLAQAAGLLGRAAKVVLFGALSSRAMTHYMAYLAQYFAPNWSLAGPGGASLGAQVASLGRDDAVLIVTMSPYAQRAIATAQLAKASGADIVLITDSYKCPALAHATLGFVVPTESPQFFSSYAVTLVLIETLIAMIVSASGEEATAAIEKVEAKNQELGEYWSGQSFNQGD